MALARLALRNLHHRIPSSALLSSSSVNERAVSSNMQKQGWGSEIFVKNFSATTSGEKASSDEKSGGREVTVSEGTKKSKLFPWRNRKKGGLWRNTDRNFVPALNEFFPSGLGDALFQATENINRLLENLSPSRLIGRVKEHDECYKVRLEVPGLSKEDLKITVEDRYLMIQGEHKEDEKEGSEDEFWYGCYNSYLILPDDAKVDDIKGELKDGVLTITIPRSPEKKKEVKEVPIQ